ncbi:unnamed protein product [Lupinus luteus]|uniref:Uncharacterized protein n=1 Tax=Lupinus luteus TaxID=3873 RepID=A0AAV1YIK9_LUPLU
MEQKRVKQQMKKSMFYSMALEQRCMYYFLTQIHYEQLINLSIICSQMSQLL